MLFYVILFIMFLFGRFSSCLGLSSGLALHSHFIFTQEAISFRSQGKDWARLSHIFLQKNSFDGSSSRALKSCFAGEKISGLIDFL